MAAVPSPSWALPASTGVKRKRPGDESRPLCRTNGAGAAIKGRGEDAASAHRASAHRKLPKRKPVPHFLGALTPNHKTKKPAARLAVMEYDFRPHEAYDVAIAALFIVFMLIVIALVFVLH